MFFVSSRLALVFFLSTIFFSFCESMASVIAVVLSLMLMIHVYDLKCYWPCALAIAIIGMLTLILKYQWIQMEQRPEYKAIEKLYRLRQRRWVCKLFTKYLHIYIGELRPHCYNFSSASLKTVLAGIFLRPDFGCVCLYLCLSIIHWRSVVGRSLLPFRATPLVSITPLSMHVFF